MCIIESVHSLLKSALNFQRKNQLFKWNLENRPLKVKGDVIALEAHFRATERHPPYGISQYYLPPDTGERALP